MINSHNNSLPKWFLFALILIVQYSAAQNCWSALGGGITSNNSLVIALTAYNGNLVATGQFDTVGGNVPANNIAAWNGTAWNALGSGITITYPAQISAMTVYNGDLYVAGTFDTAGGTPVSGIAKWDGTAWLAVGQGIKLQRQNQQPFAMVVYNNALYVAGRFDTAGGVAATNIAKWDGISWSAVGAGLGVAGTSNTSDSNGVFSLAVYNNMLVAGGSFSNASGLPVNNIAAWNGTAWLALNNGINGGVQAMALYQDNLYASLTSSDGAGNFTYFISMWNGSSWANIVSGPGTGTNYYGYVISLLPFNGKLLASGDFNVTGNSDTLVTGIAQWDGSTWSQFVGLAEAGTGFYPMVIYDGHLYAGGEFSQAGTTTALNIAEYTCAVSGINEITKSGANIYPNPTNGIINISLDNADDKANIQIYNLLGQNVLRSNLGFGKTEINLTGQAAGNYMYRIVRNDGTLVAAGLFIIQ